MIRSFEKHAPDIHASAWVDATALVLGDVTIGADSSVWPMTVVRGDIHRIEIGARTNIQDGSVLHVTHDSRFVPGGRPLVVGDGVTVGHRVVLHACTIGDGCLIGMGSVVMDGAVVEAGVLLGAGSLVTPGKHLEGGYLWQGSPARRVRELTDQERAYLAYSAEHYVRLKNRHAAG
jgi:carbonic anhydrase/acetyltransferase-like protein (isoleucine patch superfamily)